MIYIVLYKPRIQFYVISTAVTDLQGRYPSEVTLSPQLEARNVRDWFYPRVDTYAGHVVEGIVKQKYIRIVELLSPIPNTSQNERITRILK